MSEANVWQYLSTWQESSLFAPEGSELVIAKWEAPGTPRGEEPEMIAPLHVHHEDDEAWYVLEGTLGFRVEDETFEANAGDVVIVPRGKAHTFWNPTLSDTTYFIIMTKRLDQLIREIHASEVRDYQAMKAIFEKHASTLLA